MRSPNRERTGSKSGTDGRETVRVGVADMGVSQNGSPLRTAGLGSCVAIGLRDRTGTGGLLHAMLPEAPSTPENPVKYVDSGVNTLIEELANQGTDQGQLTAKVAGGSFMLDITRHEPINERNVNTTHQILAERDIELLAADTGGEHPRSVTFYPSTGTMRVSTEETETRL